MGGWDDAVVLNEARPVYPRCRGGKQDGKQLKSTTQLEDNCGFVVGVSKPVKKWLNGKEWFGQ